MNRRLWLLLFCFIVLAAITLLSSSLHDVHFLPGRSLSVSPTTDTPVLIQASETLTQTPLWKILLLWLAFIVNLFLFIFLLPPDVRKRILRQVISFSIGLLILFISLKYRILQLPGLNSEAPHEANQTPAGLDAGSSLPAFHPPQVTPWMTYLISLSVMLAVLFIVLAARRRWMHSRAGNYPELQAFADIARASLDELASGRDWGDVIIQSYVRMSEVVSVHRGLQRHEAATPREFALRLEKAGLPAEAIHRLTRLFESVRYGARKSDPAEMQEAVACLDSILQACGLAQ